MNLNRGLKFNIIIILGLIFSGCTSNFEPRFDSGDLTRLRLPTAREIRSGLEVSAEEFASPHKSRRVFDADVATNGVLPLLVRLENKGTQTYTVRRNGIRAFQKGEPLDPIYGFQAANEGAARDLTWNALVNTAMWGPAAMFLWPATIAVSSSQTQTVNRKIEHHFESLELPDTLLKPDQQVAGFVYFKILPGQERLENLTVEVAVEKDGYSEETGEKVVYRLSLPSLEIQTRGGFLER